ncbi:hypothetical protein FB45DRAFT_1034480 [Roridomyces roridus]|uniref:Transmembrane protein n=1 Tax=Roridomyces roridus TaxID=1738132 RepID=A0AAD7FFL4_9AGAR|nr:hypothetical protein FB45DRAFT_1034480 [Roridomyces roridus]
MPSVNVSVDVTSPLINYAGNWQLGGADGDPGTVNYSMQTFQYCQVVPCTASILFNGSEVHFVGAWRGNSGPWQVDLDETTYGPFAPAINQPPWGIFQVDKYNRTGLSSSGPHMFTVGNLPPTFWWTTDINNTADFVIQDDSHAFSYSPVTQWDADLAILALTDFSQNTGHVTSANGAEATLEFMGDRVALYGAVGDIGGPYSVSIDGGSPALYSSKTKILHGGNLTQQMIFYADHLPAGNHTLTLTSEASSSSDFISIDFAIVDGTVNTGATAPPGPSPSPSEIHSLSKGALGGIIAGTALAISSICLLLLFLWRRRRRGAVKLDLTEPEENHNGEGGANVGYIPYLVTPFEEGRGADPPRYDALSNVGWDTSSRDAVGLVSRASRGKGDSSLPATTNKALYREIMRTNPKDIEWVPQARWVVDGNVWTSSGVAAGSDMTLAFVEHLAGPQVARVIRGWMEIPEVTEKEDPFAVFHGLV